MAEGVVETFKVVVALDIGTTYSGYAFSFRSDYDVDPLKVQTPQGWIAGESNLLSYKTSSSLLLDKKGDFKSFGFEAETLYASDPNPEDLTFFHRFKMNLYNCKDISKKLMIHDITGTKTVKALKVFSLTIKALVDAFFKLVKDKGLDNAVIPDRILWVITVPAIWPPSARVFMIQSAKEAGLKENQISIALEPEAGAICCQHYAHLNLSEKGTKYLVADLGGGTADLTVHEKVNDGSLRELHKADGIGVGGTNVDKLILEFLSDVTETPDLQKKLCEMSQFDLYRAIEILKRRVRYDSDEDVVIDLPDLVLKDDRNIKNDIKNLVQKYCERKGRIDIKIRHHSKVAMSANILKDMFADTTKKIIERMQKVLDESKSSDEIKIILLVGGFSESSVVVGEIRKHFEAKAKKVIVPTSAGLAILQGAVIYGHDNDIIMSRVLTHSYGKSVCRVFDSTKDRGRQTLFEDGVLYCTDVYDEIVPANKEIKRGEEIIQVVSTLMDFQPAVQITFYACPNRKPDYVDDPDCTEVGSVLIPLIVPMSAGRPIFIHIRFGGTVIRVTARDALFPIQCSTTLKLKED